MALLGLLCGLGLYAKLLFVWIIGGMIGALVIVNLPLAFRILNTQFSIHKSRLVELRRLPGVRSLISNIQSLTFLPRTPYLADCAGFAAGLLLGLLPLIAYNLQTGGTLLSVGANLTTSYYGVNNLNVAENLRGRIDQFQAVIAGRDHLWYLGGSFGNPGWETALRVAALAIGLRALLLRQRSQLPLALLLLLALGVFQTSFTVSGLFPTHFAIFAPLWPIIVALACEIVFDPFYEPLMIHLNGPPLSTFMGSVISGWVGFLNVGMVILAFAVGGLWARDVAVTIDYHRALNASGGLGPHSDAVYRLADYLESNGEAAVAAMDWGFAPQVKIVFHFPQETIFPRHEAFDSFIAAQGWQAEQITVISRRDGGPVFEIVRIKK
jgi:hypothetical protein